MDGDVSRRIQLGGGVSGAAGWASVTSTSRKRAERTAALEEVQTALIEIAEMAGETFDLGEIVRRNEDGGTGGAFEKAFNELVANEWVEAAERFVENDELWAVGERGNQRRFHLHAAGEMFEFAVGGQVELLEHFGGAGVVPGGIKGLR